jgi:hypothetical protein
LKEGVDVHVHSHHWAQFTTFTVKPGLEGNPMQSVVTGGSARP